MSNERRARVALYWGGDVIYESDTVRYSCGARTVAKLPLNVEYDWLVRNLHIRMKTNPNELKLVISGRWPFSTVRGYARYSEIPILDNESLKDFMVAPDTVRYMMNLDLLEMYIKTEALDVVEPTHNLNSPSFNFVAPSLNLNDPPPDFYEPSTIMTSNFSEFQSFTSFLSQSITSQIDIPSSSYGHGCTDFGTNFDVDNYHHYDFRDGAGTSSLPEVPEITRVSEIHARIEVDAYADTHANDNSDSEAPNDAYETDEMSDSGDDNEDDQQPVVHVPQNISFHRENIPFLYDLQDRPEVYASTHEAEGVGCKIWLDDKESDLKSGQLFPSKERLKTAVKIWSLRGNREFTVWESKKNYWTVKCRRWESGCDWMLRGRKTPTNLWTIGKYYGRHTCQMGVIQADHFNLDSKLIASLLLPYLRNNPQFKVKDVQTTVEVELKHTPSYKKAWLGRRRAFKFIYGDFDQSFAQLPMYMNALQHFNSGTVVEWMHADESTSEVNVFKYVFWAFKPCIKGFKRCRPVISIDGTHIYGKYDLKMLIAVTADANGQIFPLAFAIVDKETKEAWSWFLSCLGIHVVAGRRGVTYISDRAPGILRSFDDLVELHEPNAYHRFCLRHVKSNFLSQFPNKQLEGLMWQAAIQHQERKFKALMQCLKDAEPSAYNYLMKIPLEKWTVHRDGGRRWGILTTNLSESFNGFLKKSRGLPITAMIKLTYGQIVERFVSRKQYAQKLINEKELWPPVVAKKILKYELKSKNHKVTAYNRESGVFEVETYRRQGRGGRKHIIKFSSNTCECQKWQAYHMPCSHLLKVTEQMNRIAHDLVSEYYSTMKYFETYRVSFQPLGDEENWPEAPFKMVCNESFIRKKGARRTTRVPNEMDVGRTSYSKACGICRLTGHDRRNCPNQERANNNRR